MKLCYGGIDLGGSFIKAGLLTKSGKQISKFKNPSGADKSPATVKTNLLQASDRLTDVAKSKGFKLVGLGVGSPGTVKYPEGIVTDSTPNIPGWIGTNVGRVFNGLDVPVKVDNDANCMALAEHTLGSAMNFDSAFFLTIGTGIGGAVIHDGKLIRGSSHAAGEFGHMILKANGRKCPGGHRGCVESYTAVPALLRAAKKYARRFKSSLLHKNLNSLTTFNIFDAFKNNDKAAVMTIEEHARFLGTAIGSVLMLLNPEIVVIGGGLSEGGSKYIKLLEKNIKEYAYLSATENLKVRKARYVNDAGWIGAACLNIVKS